VIAEWCAGTPRRTGVLTLAGLSVALLLSGCARSGGVTPRQAAWRTDLENVITEAQQHGVGADQLALLRTVEKSARGITYAEYEAAVRATLRCDEAAGVKIDGPRPGHMRGLPTLVYGYGGLTTADAERLRPLHERCAAEHSQYIELMYTSQPSAMEWEDRIFEKYRPALVSCLHKHGSTVAATVSRDALESEISRVMSSKPNYGGPNCTVESGLNDALDAP
jgi:hypothetical protein